MSFSYTADADSDVATVVGHGPFELEETCRLLEQLASDPSLTPDTRFIVDLREMQSLPDGGDATRLRAVFERFRARFRGRQAVLVASPAQRSVGLMLRRVIGGGVGIPIEVFDHEAVAQGWLHGDVEVWLVSAHAAERGALRAARQRDRRLPALV